MTVPNDQAQSAPRKNILTKRWLIIVNALILLPLAAFGMRSISRMTPADGANAPIVENALAAAELTATNTAAPTASNTAKPTITNTASPTLTNTATRTATRTATVTRTPKPTLTATITPSATPETMVKVSAPANLRAGPDVNYELVEALGRDDPLALLGRLSDDLWLYVRTAGGNAGWIKTSLVDLSGTSVGQQPIQTPPPLPETWVTVVKDFVNLRTGPGFVYGKVKALDYSESLQLLGRLDDKSWLYVKTLDGLEGWVETSLVEVGSINLNYHPVQTAPPTPTTTPVILDIDDRWIDIDISEQKLYAYESSTLVATFLVSTGTERYPTERGQFKIDIKMRYSDMHGPGYFLPDVPYTMYYYNSYAIHGTYWHHNFGTPMSRGCINMDTKDAEWLFNWASVGTVVNVHR